MKPLIESWPLEILQARGWLTDAAACIRNRSWETLERAVGRFQAHVGLYPSGTLDADTLAELAAPRMCGLPDVMEARDSLCKWPDGDVTYCVVDAFPGLTREQTVAAFDWAMGEVAKVCGVRPRRVDAPRQARIVSRCGRIDGPGKTLAWSELPCGQVAQCQQMYDSGEAWTDKRPIPAGRTLAFLVVLHELLHALGVPHIGAGNVMAPTYNPDLLTLQAGDVAELVARYPKVQAPAPTPVPVPVPGQPPAKCVLRVDAPACVDEIVIPGWRVLRI